MSDNEIEKKKEKNRLIQEPKRLFKRYIIGNPLFIARIILEKYRIINYDIR